MSEKAYYKQETIKSIESIISEMSETLDALNQLKSAVESENLSAIKEAESTIANHIATGYGEHLRFDVPRTWSFTNELELEAEENQSVITLDAKQEVSLRELESEFIRSF